MSPLIPWSLPALWLLIKATHRYWRYTEPKKPGLITFRAVCPKCQHEHLMTIPEGVYLEFEAFCKCSQLPLNFRVVDPHAPDHRSQFALRAFTKPRY